MYSTFENMGQYNQYTICILYQVPLLVNITGKLFYCHHVIDRNIKPKFIFVMISPNPTAATLHHS